MNPPHLTLRDVLNAYKSGDLSLRDAEEEIQGLQIEELGDIARIDTGRTVRCGIPEVVLGEGKNRDHLIEIILTLVRRTGKCIATRVPEDVGDEIARVAADEDFSCEYHPVSHTLVASRLPAPSTRGGHRRYSHCRDVRYPGGRGSPNYCRRDGLPGYNGI